MSKSPDANQPLSDDSAVDFSSVPSAAPILAAPLAAQPAAPLGINPGGFGLNAVNKSLPSKSTRKRSRKKYWIGGLLVLFLGIAVTAVVLLRPEGARADLIYHKVKRERLEVSVTEKGTLESSANTDLICKVRAGTKGAGSGYATSINKVVDDGTRVNPGDELMVLDDSALEDQRKDQDIKVANAFIDKIQAEQDYEIQLKNNEIDIANAKSALLNAEIALERLLGFELDSNQVPLGAVGGVLAMLRENGAYRLGLDDLSGQITNAQSDVEQNQERSSWSQRMVKQSYMSPAQAEADKSRLESSQESLRSLRAKRALMLNYDRRQQVADLTTKKDNAEKALDKAILTANALEKKLQKVKEIKQAVYAKEFDRLADILQQQSYCHITAPKYIRHDSMVVYFKPEGNRFGTQQQQLVEQGAQVKEGQKMLRIPNLEQMQVNTKIHEAMVSRVKGDVRVATRLSETLQIAMYANTNPLLRAFTSRPEVLDLISSSNVTTDSEEAKPVPVHDLEFLIKEPGQRTIVKIDAMPDKRYLGHVKSVSQVANQNDVMMSDVKLYPTLVNVDNEIGSDGQLLPVSGEVLKPDMTAEVTISVDAAKEPVLTVPLQAVIGGAEMGATREVFVRMPNGPPQRRKVVLGLFNDKVIEVREGLEEGDEVVTNPKALLGDSKVKTRDGKESGGKGGDGKEGGGGEKKKKGGAGGPGGKAPGA